MTGDSKLVFQSLVNELALDESISTRLYPERNLGLLRRFKPLKSFPLYERFGFLFLVFLVAVAFGSMFLMLLGPFLGLLACLIYWIKPIGRKPLASPYKYVIVSSSYDGRRLILENENINPAEVLLFDPKRHPPVSLLEPQDFAWIGLNAWKLLFLILAQNKFSRLGLLIQAYDSINALFLLRILQRSDAQFFTNDHYQRWAFLLSHGNKVLVMYQHGFIDASISFPFPGGEIKKLVVYDLSFSAIFDKFYHVGYVELLGKGRQLSKAKSSISVMVASSANSSTEELEFLTQLRVVRPEIIVVLKLHPNHQYGVDKEKLLSISDCILGRGDYPICSVFVSHDSFLRFDYERNGIPTVSLSDFDAIEDAVRRVDSFLAAQ
jgi:hypothetical protein